MTLVQSILSVNQNRLIEMKPEERSKWLREHSGMPLILIQKVNKMDTEKFTRWLNVCINGSNNDIINFR